MPNQMETNDQGYSFQSDVDKKPDEDMECATATHPHSPGVLLPWDMD